MTDVAGGASPFAFGSRAELVFLVIGVVITLALVAGFILMLRRDERAESEERDSADRES